MTELFRATITEARELLCNGLGTARELHLELAYEGKDSEKRSFGGYYEANDLLVIPLPEGDRYQDTTYRSDLIGKTLLIQVEEPESAPVVKRVTGDSKRYNCGYCGNILHQTSPSYICTHCAKKLSSLEVIITYL